MTEMQPQSELVQEFKREPRYIVFKLKDIQAYLSHTQIEALQTAGETIAAGRALAGKPPFNAVVVEQDWPEFEMVWNAIEARMGGQGLMITESERDAFEDWLTENVDPDNPSTTSFRDVWRAAVKHEREACAKICEEPAQLSAPYSSIDEWLQASGWCAEAIRKRSNVEVSGAGNGVRWTAGLEHKRLRKL